MKTALILIAAVTALFTAACVQIQQEPNKTANVTKNVSLQPECSSDSDCFIGGCSGQLCTAKEGVMSTCEYRAEYGCVKLTSCGCVDRQCGWRQNDQYAKCLEDANGQSDVERIY